jgi:RHS repeat-associated protein
MARYFYHPDHIGSSSWITDGTGQAIQHLHYLPFGEDWVDQRNSSWNAPYTFSGKEKDVETGYGYFGARYYDSGLSIWLSVDPMSDKYPSMSPYNYCANNPVILVDPDGREIEPYLIFNGDLNKIQIFDDNNTPDDYTDDAFIGEYDAHNNVDKSSNGKWEDGVYEMQDKNSPHKHGKDKNGVKKDSKNGAYGEAGCYRAKSFKETMSNLFRIGMAVHAGRENKSFLKRFTMGCIRVEADAMEAIQNAINSYGPLNRIIIQNNRESASSSDVNKINPSSAPFVPLMTDPKLTPIYNEQDNTRVNVINSYNF